MPAEWNGSFAITRKRNNRWQIIVERTIFDSDPARPMFRFPGGKKEEEDQDSLDTALRELKEESGLILNRNSGIIQLAHIPVPDDHFQDYFWAALRKCGGRFESKVIRRDDRVQQVFWRYLDEAIPILHKHHQTVATDLKTRLDAP